MKLVVSMLPKTWILDLDGTLVKHNGYLTGKDELLPGVKEFFKQVRKEDFVIILTSRTEDYREVTENFLREQGIRYDLIVFGLGQGERILINDMKPSGMITAVAVNKKRDEPLELQVITCEKL